MKLVLGVVAAIACFVLAESLSCNKCTIGISGFCLIPGTDTCSTNTSVCYGTKATFANVSSFSGFSIRGCTEPSTSCNGSSTGTVTSTGSVPVVNLVYTVTTTCCNTDKCNNGASATKMTLSVALSAAALAAFWGTYM